MLIENKTTIHEILDKSFERINKYNPSTNAWIEVWIEESYRIAKELQKNKTEKLKNPLFGIPIGLKDLIDFKGKNTSQGINNYNCISDEHASIVKKILDLKMIPIGKQNLVEIALGITGHNPSLGNINNPIDLNFIPGGSSSGSAVSTVTGMTPISLGTDTGGSVRIPSAMCGAVGFKPTYGVLNLTGVKTLSESLDHLGIITNYVEDNKLFFNIITDNNKDIKPEFSKLKVAIPLNKRFQNISSKFVNEHFEKFLSMLVKNNIEIEYINLPWIDQARKITLDILLAEAYQNHKIKYSDKKVSKYIYNRLSIGKNISEGKVNSAKFRKQSFTRKMEKILTKYDAIVSPTIPIKTPKISDSDPSKSENKDKYGLIAEFTSIYNLTGQPSITIPFGKDNNSLPMGVMISGKKNSDIKILNIAKFFENLIIENEK